MRRIMVSMGTPGIAQRRPVWRVLALGCLLTAAAVSPALADGFDGQRFVPAPGAAGGFQVERPLVPAHLGFGLGLYLGVADDLVVERDLVTGAEISTPLDSAVTLDLIGSIGLFDFGELALQLPLHIHYAGDPTSIDGEAVEAEAGPGDLRVVPRFAFWRRPGAGPGLGFGVSVPVSLPTGDDLELRGAGRVTVEPKLLFGVLGWTAQGVASLGYRWRGGGDPLVPGDELTFGLAGTFVLPTRQDIVDLQAELVGGFTPSLDGRAWSRLPLEVLAGAIIKPHPRWRIHAGGGVGLTNAPGVPDFRFFIGLRYARGLPGKAGEPDRDDDGIPDRSDRCDDAAEDKDGFEDADGCPEPDNDHDGIADDHDECPDDPEEPGGDRDGCPDKPKIVVRRGQVVIFGKIQFEIGSAAIQTKSGPLLDDLAKALQEHPQIKKVEIQGHTDDTGDSGFNLKLSEERAQAVKTALVARGVSERRLAIRGYGEGEPMAPNETPAGRARNRRVEFVIKE